MARSFRELIVWRQAMVLVEDGYRIVRRLPQAERYLLGNQISRAVVSVPSNIAEGCGRGSQRDYARFLSIARGSLAEFETLVLLTARLGYVADSEIDPVLDRVQQIGKMLAALQRHLRNRVVPKEGSSHPRTHQPQGPLLTVNYQLLTLPPCPLPSANGRPSSAPVSA